MPVALLDINDCKLRLWTDGAPLESPGYALFDGGAYRFGEAARASARLRPRDINNRFWWQLGTAPLQPALGPARHTADLVHAHLEHLHAEGGAPDELLLACPGSMPREQLSLLLGIAQQCPFRIVGLVDRAVLLAAGQRADAHLELQLHQALLTRFSHDGERVSVQRSTPLPGCGLLQLQEQQVQVVADAFIRQTRFDPRRRAASEQALYDALPGALATLSAHSECDIEIDGYRVRLDRSGLTSAAGRLFQAAHAALDDAASLLVDPLVALLPGMAEAFPQARKVDEQQLRASATALEAQLVVRDTALAFVTELPCLDGAADDTETAQQPAPVARPPTHLLQGASAQPLAAAGTPLAAGVSIVLDAGAWTLRGAALVNGASAASGQALATGDCIVAGEREFRLIEVVDHGS
ncbi:hypothetical protein E4634_02390 [Mangrovimicrobium sediminis]|uniref:Uncharacterized protein n=1 Tax=Mangrovimicrobium sediminis TaxID=2562682 RepID=A0A4Z0M8W8_9GAMM|nr:hypothetical protein [Haliea sp. SAOS-164]TGD75745.1 hypothetical protein E4634_02390 [Haliea sp. SAOS-164]